MFIENQLKNNILFLGEKNDASKVCSIGFWFASGSRYEDKNTSGISHFTEHMIFKGTKCRSAKDISAAFDRMGGSVNAFTEREDVCLYSTVPVYKKTQNLLSALEIMADMSYNCTFEKNEFEKEREVIINEIIASLDDSEEASLDEAWAFAWPGQQFSKPIAGTVKEVENIKVEDIKSWYKKYFVQGELVVCLSGSFDEQTVISYLEKLPLRNKALSFPKELHFSEKNIIWQKGLDLKDSDFNQVQILSMYPFPADYNEKQFWAMAVFNAFAGDSMASRLFQSLRENKGLCYSVYSFFSFYEGIVSWSAFTSANEKNAFEAAELLHKEITELLFTEGADISQEEFEDAREHMAGEEIIGGEDSEYRMKRLYRNFQSGFPQRTTEEVCNLIRSLTKDDLLDIIKKIKCDENAFVVYGPKVKRKFKKFSLKNI